MLSHAIYSYEEDMDTLRDDRNSISICTGRKIMVYEKPPQGPSKAILTTKRYWGADPQWTLCLENKGWTLTDMVH